MSRSLTVDHPSHSTTVIRFPSISAFEIVHQSHEILWYRFHAKQQKNHESCSHSWLGNETSNFDRTNHTLRSICLATFNILGSSSRTLPATSPHLCQRLIKILNKIPHTFHANRQPNKLWRKPTCLARSNRQLGVGHRPRQLC